MRQRLKQSRRTGDRYVAWRALCLRNAGFEPSEASRIASNLDFDVHALLELVDRGCPPELAARILAPLDGEASQP